MILVISEFAKAAGVTVKTLLHYDKLGLLKAKRNKTNDYRIYDKSDFVLIQQITLLKFIGLSLNEIKDIISNTTFNMDDIIKMQLDALKRKRSHLDTVIESLNIANQVIQDQGDLEVEHLTNIIKTTHMEARLKEQYKTDVNLNSRLNIYQYTKNNKDFSTWCSEQLKIKDYAKVLEVGCGNGLFWKKSSHKYPDHIQVILSDASEGMLKDARENLREIQRLFDYHIQDVQNLTYDNNSFDMVIAKHMLYHIPNLDQALSEIKRVLKPSGQFIASTNSMIHMSELEKIVKDFDHTIEYNPTSYAIKFGVESGQRILNEHFETVRVYTTKDELILTDIEPIVRYIKSTVGNARDILVGSKLDAFEKYLKDFISKKGHIKISTNAGLLVCSDKKRS